MRYVPLTLLFTLFLCTCGRDPLSIEEVAVDLPVQADGLTASELVNDGVFTSGTELLPAHQDLTVKLSYRLLEAAEASLLLQGQHALSLNDLTLAGFKPQRPAIITPGVWHDLELVYAAGKDGNPAIVSELYLDGNQLHYSRELPATQSATGGLDLQITKGGVELTSVRTAPSAGTGSRIGPAGEVMLNVPLLEYKAYKLAAPDKNFSDWEREPDARGYIKRIHNTAVNPGSPNYVIAYTGPLNIPKSGSYEFRTWGPGKVRLYLDDKLLVDHGGQPHWETKGKHELAAGDYDFRFEYFYSGGWDRMDLGYTFEDQEERFINTMEESRLLAAPGLNEPLVVASDDRPYILRSFAYFPAPKVYEDATKRTHVVSVGEGQGPHYSVDLQTGALLQVWRGEFADVQDMWIARGEPQVMRPLGLAVAFDGRPQWAESAENSWPDLPREPDTDDFQHSAYELDDAGRPTFYYETGSASVSDRLTPDGDGLLRELTYSAGGGDSYTLVASAAKITETSPGEYELRGPGMTISITSYDGDGLYLQRGGGVERLIAHMEPAGHLRYRMDW